MTGGGFTQPFAEENQLRAVEGRIGLWSLMGADVDTGKPEQRSRNECSDPSETEMEREVRGDPTLLKFNVPR